MAEAVYQTMTALCTLTALLAIGTNIALLHLLWSLISGALLPSRGALFPALQITGLLPPVIRRAWAALCSSSWQINNLLLAWEQYVIAQGKWQAHQYDGYVPKAIDISVFWRPALKGCQTKHFFAPAGKALPAIVLGLIARVGNVKNSGLPY
ncbi:hypothetical protein HY793_01760 [Candidatus Desantisbacteria bacterium]|nr:hypothetical protein [Candidatus Desantisbacteria bacterium]